MERIVSYISILEVIREQRKLLAHCQVILNNLSRERQQDSTATLWRDDEGGEGAKFERSVEEVRDKMMVVN